MSRSKQDRNAGKTIGETETNEDTVPNNDISKVCVELQNAQKVDITLKRGVLGWHKWKQLLAVLIYPPKHLAYNPRAYAYSQAPRQTASSERCVFI